MKYWIFFFLICFMSCDKNKGMEEVATPYSKEVDFFLFKKENGAITKYDTDTTTMPPSPLPYLSFYENRQFEIYRSTVDVNGDIVTISELDFIFKGVEVCDCSSLTLREGMSHTYSRVNPGYLDIHAQVLGTPNAITGEGYEIIYAQNQPNTSKKWYLSTDPNFFESTFIREENISGTISVKGNMYNGIQKIYTSSNTWYYQGDTTSLDRKKLTISFDEEKMHIQVGDFQVALPKEFITYEGQDLIYDQNRDPNDTNPYLVTYVKAHVKHIDGKIHFYFEDHVYNSAGDEPRYTQIFCISD